MGKVIDFNAEANRRAMETEESLFKVVECKTFIVKTASKNIPDLVEASEKYGIDFPDVEYKIICHKESGKYQLDYYLEFEGYGNTYFQFGLPVDISEDCMKEYALAMLESNLDNMYWGDALKMYLEECGIEYEEDD